MARITESEVLSAYRAILKRDPESREVIDYWTGSRFPLERLLEHLVNSAEFAMSFTPMPATAVSDFRQHNNRFYTIPQDLRRTDSKLGRVLLQGSCLMEAWIPALRKHGIETPIDLVLFASDMPDTLPHPFDAYSFHIAQIPLRGVLLEGSYAEWLRAPYSDEQATDRLLNEACEIVDFWIERILRWAREIPTFVVNYMTPQYNVNGRHFHRSDATSNLYLMEQINRHIERRVFEHPNLYLMDMNHLASIYGRRFIQDDSIWHYAHGGFIGDHDFTLDQDRIVRVPAPSAHYSHQVGEFICGLWLEAEAMYRSLRSIDSVKMVCVDLDDTLWRGVLAEADNPDYQSAVEGWPLGIAEALLSLRRRGVILALVSKNDLERIKAIWPRVFQRRLLLEDFAILKVSWNNKVQSINEAMQEANLLPRNVIFVDDNPRERETVEEAIPDLRVVHASHYYWKRILMWSAETQGVTITAESTRRTEMIKSQIQRETERKTLSREEFLARLNLKAAFGRITGQSDPRFPRTLELLNKTNQFNTTGRRWSTQELDDICSSGLVLVGEVADRHAEYGLVVIGIASAQRIEQVVMSCRVVGLDVEIAMVSLLTEALLRDNAAAVAVSKHTDANLLSRDLFEKCGWSVDGDLWRTTRAVPLPAHVEVAYPGAIA
ncbi:hypothetical protein WS67_17270 [Burkholderia singularis]|uniref:HAD-IIIC family phosphatase n=1 Tax=Burkholderia singularis TaxID=1503053 RepID=A0A103E0E4_9BURK|nr:HAD-IIIC family phosphatase [Burkholderia singularis]KVE26112.1 hypothetical protein WS67_17270 [Burkholderia singularis]